MGFKAGVSIQDQDEIIQKPPGGEILKRNEALNSVLVRVEDEQAFINEIIKEDRVKYAERNGIFHVQYHTPNDPLWGFQWGPQKIKCPEAWQKEIGSLEVLIAIVDTGISYKHVDLKGHYVAGGNDWVNDDIDPRDDHGHGTHCAGIAAATMDNHIGIAGVAQVGVMAEKVCNEGGWCTWFNCAHGITHATAFGADVISMSFGGYLPSTVMRDACQYAWDNGVVLVGAAGSDGLPLISYPAGYDTVICVGSIGPGQVRSWFSNYGLEMELVAPGEDIFSTFPGNNYAYWSGTSMSTAHVAGVAALVISHFPGWTNSEVRTRLQETADDLGPTGWDDEYGYGVVNAGCALFQEPDLVVNKSVTIEDGTFTVNYTVTNIGDGPAGASNTTIYIDSVNVLEDPVPALASGDSFTNTVGPFECPCGTTLNVTVCADNGNVVEESDETNNCLENEWICKKGD